MSETTPTADSAEIECRLDRLRTEYGDFPVETAVTDLPAAAYRRARELHDRGIPGAARVWVERGDEALLVRERSRPDSWGVAGGLVEPDEPAARTGEREVREETGVECRVVDVADAHRATRRHEQGAAEPFEELAVAFVADYVRGELERQPAEICEAAWWSSLPESVHPPADRLWDARFE